MTERRQASMPDWMDEYLRQNNISFSAFVQDAIEDRMLQDGASIDHWKESYGD